MGVGESTLTVDARERLVVAVVPPQVTAVFGKRVDLQLSNPGSVDRSLTLTQRRRRRRRAAPVAETSVVVPAGQTSTVRGRIKVRHPRMFGSGGVHAVGVTARDSGAPEHAEATVRARPLIRNGLRAGVILGLVLTPVGGRRRSSSSRCCPTGSPPRTRRPRRTPRPRPAGPREPARPPADRRRRDRGNGTGTGGSGCGGRRQRREPARDNGSGDTGVPGRRRRRGQPTGRDGDRTGADRGDRQGGVDQPGRRRGRGGEHRPTPVRPGRDCGRPRRRRQGAGLGGGGDRERRLPVPAEDQDRTGRLVRLRLPDQPRLLSGDVRTSGFRRTEVHRRRVHLGRRRAHAGRPGAGQRQAVRHRDRTRRSGGRSDRRDHRRNPVAEHVDRVAGQSGQARQLVDVRAVHAGHLPDHHLLSRARHGEHAQDADGRRQAHRPTRP